MTTLQQISTRELLRELRSRRQQYQRTDSPDKEGFEKRNFVASRLVKGGEYSAAVATTDELQAELATRPHVHAKPEGRALRRLMAKTGWTEEELRAHPRFGMELADVQNPGRVSIPSAHVKFYTQTHGKSFGKRFKVRPK